MRKIRLTESELISLIKRVINEQDEVYSNFVNSNMFRNCRGIRLSDRTVWDSHDWSRKVESNSKEEEREDKQEMKDFNKTNSTNIKDLQYFRALRDDSLKIKNNNATGYYNGLFDEDGKPFTKNLTQKKINIIEGMFKGGSGWYFYFRDIFGSKNPTILELYNHIESIGGLEKYKELAKSGYNAKKYIDILSENSEVANNLLKAKFPFEKPSSKTPFYFVWNEGKGQGSRYFNTFEEWKLALEIAKTEGNRPLSNQENGAATAGEALFSSKPTLGEATPQLFK